MNTPVKSVISSVIATYEEQCSVAKDSSTTSNIIKPRMKVEQMKKDRQIQRERKTARKRAIQVDAGCSVSNGESTQALNIKKDWNRRTRL